MTEPVATPVDAHAHAGHSHAVGPDADRRYLRLALVLLSAFLVVEVALGIKAQSLALLSDAGHMLTDVAALVLALVAMRVAARPATGRYTFGFKRIEILSAQANGLTLLLLGAWLAFEGVHRLIDPPDVQGGLVLVVALVGVAVNLVATWLLSRANRTSLNVEGAFQHLLTDLYAFIGTAVAGLVVLTTGYQRADPIAALLVAALMLRSGFYLLRDSGRIFLEASPSGLEPTAVRTAMGAVDGVLDVHDLHIWEVTSGFPSMSAHVLVATGQDCHRVRLGLQTVIANDFGITHSTMQVDHVDEHTAPGLADGDRCCVEPHGP
jgi:cobalt-zinc-cadmium efflux system protein